MSILQVEEASKDIEPDLRKEGGLWLKRRREEVGLSQRELAQALGLKFYSFISQVENGRTRVPPELLRPWAEALQMPVKNFARMMLRHFDPVLFSALFDDEN